MKTIKRLAGFLWLPLACCLAVFLLFRFVFFLGYVPSESMEPTIQANSFIIGNRIYSGLFQGDIVIFEKDGQCLVKRIAAVPGDTVLIPPWKQRECFPSPRKAILSWETIRTYLWTADIGKTYL